MWSLAQPRRARSFDLEAWKRKGDAATRAHTYWDPWTRHFAPTVSLQVGGNPAMDWHPIQGHEILFAAGNRI